uniref:Uncharacterized protein n=1 Tax=Rhizophora mucronata TaxID=61149 RepID=A0A2P2ITZ1_RHIMU
MHRHTDKIPHWDKRFLKSSNIYQNLKFLRQIQKNPFLFLSL